MSKINIKKVILASMFAAVITVATMIVRFPSPAGYVNLGDGFVLISSWLLGPVYGALAAAIGSALADLLSGYAIYIAPTFIIKGLMALCAWTIFTAINKKTKKRNTLAYVIAAICAELVMVLGYFLTDMLMYDVMVSLQCVIGNLVQGVVGATAGVLMISLINKYNLHEI